MAARGHHGASATRPSGLGCTLERSSGSPLGCRGPGPARRARGGSRADTCSCTGTRCPRAAGRSALCMLPGAAPGRGARPRPPGPGRSEGGRVGTASCSWSVDRTQPGPPSSPPTGRSRRAPNRPLAPRGRCWRRAAVRSGLSRTSHHAGPAPPGPREVGELPAPPRAVLGPSAALLTRAAGGRAAGVHLPTAPLSRLGAAAQLSSERRQVLAWSPAAPRLVEVVTSAASRNR